MRRLYGTSRLSLLAGIAAAGIAAAMAMPATLPRGADLPKPAYASARRKKRKRKGPMPNAVSGRTLSDIDLAPRLSSSIRKLRRYYRANPKQVWWPNSPEKVRAMQLRHLHPRHLRARFSEARA